MGLRSTVISPSGVWDAAKAEIELGTVGLKMETNIVKLLSFGEVIFALKIRAPNIFGPYAAAYLS